MQQVADIEQLDRSRAANDRAFAELLKPLIEPGFRLALAMLRDPAAAEDAVQEASFTAWRKIGRINDRGKLRAWFLGVVANKCRNARRLKWTAAVNLSVPEHVAVVSDEEHAVSRADVRAAVARLRHDDRLVIALYFYLDLPIEEVAAVTRSSVGATRARLYRSIHRLRPDLAFQEALR